MKLRKIKIRLKCDNGVCPNNADYAVERSGTPACRELRLCRDCLKELARLNEALSVSEKCVGKNQTDGG